MSDETTTEAPEQPASLKVFTCYNPRHPTRSCYALIEDASEPKRLHREWHDSLHSKEEGQRKAIKARDEEIARLHEAIGEYGRAVEAYQHEVAGVHGEVQRVETPTPAPALEINRDGYTDDELADDPEDTDEDDDWALPAASFDDLTRAAAPAEAATEPAEAGYFDEEPRRALTVDDASIGLGTHQPWSSR